jgi:hypothetical protein
MAGLARARGEGKQLGRRSVEQSHSKKVKAALTQVGFLADQPDHRPDPKSYLPSNAADAEPLGPQETTLPL